MTIFCKSCETITCFLGDHPDHNYGKIGVVSRDLREKLAKERARIWMRLDGLKVSQEFTKNNKEDLLKRRDILTEDLHKHCEQVVQLVKRKFGVLAEQLRSMVDKELGNLTRIKNKNDVFAKRLNHVSSVYETLTVRASDTNLMYFYRNFMKLLKISLPENEEINETSKKGVMKNARIEVDASIKKTLNLYEMDNLYNQIA